MSGPITAGFCIVHGVVQLSALALKEARAMRREYGAVLAQLQERERQQAQARRGQRAARVARLAAVRSEAQRLAARVDRLRSLAGALAARAPDIAAEVSAPAIAAPVGDDDAAWGDYLGALDAAARQMQARLADAGIVLGDQARAALAATAGAPSVDDVLAAFALQRQLQPGLDTSAVDRFRQTAARVLARLELPPGSPLPSDLEALAKAIVLAPSVERAEALATELRRAVQDECDTRVVGRREIADALHWLDELPADAPVALVRALERVAAGVARMDGALREAARAALAAGVADREREDEAAAALVLQESLRDLGYDVEDIEATLFVAGGAVHFRRPGWERYFVRLRVDPHERTVNCNVVRARGDEESAERRRLDVLAEDRWCAEFPRLLHTLASRGLQLDVTRRLGAGDLPVQVVDGTCLPAIPPDESATRPRAVPRRRGRP